MTVRSQYKVTLTILLAMLPTLGVARPVEETQVGRYSTIAAVPTRAQTDPLQFIVTERFPDTIHSVGAALEHLLRHSGYRLASAHSSDPIMAVLTAHALPQVHRTLGPLPLEQALNTLVGPAFRLVIDPVHRLLSFEVAATHRALFPTTTRKVLLAGIGPPPATMPAWRFESAVTVSGEFPSKAPCSPDDNGPVRRDLTVLFAERRYLLPSGVVCTPNGLFVPAAQASTRGIPLTTEPAPTVSPPGLSPFEDWPHGGNR